jgi:hypothetical protein
MRRTARPGNTNAFVRQITKEGTNREVSPTKSHGVFPGELASSFSLRRSHSTSSEAECDEHSPADILTSGIEPCSCLPVPLAWNSGSIELVTRHSGATVPDSHGVPGRWTMFWPATKAGVFKERTGGCLVIRRVTASQMCNEILPNGWNHFGCELSLGLPVRLGWVRAWASGQASDLPRATAGGCDFF